MAGLCVLLSMLRAAPRGAPRTTGGLVGSSLSFSGAGSTDAEGAIISYAWTFEDGTSASGVRPLHGCLRSRLLEVAREKIVRVAQRLGIKFKQTYQREGQVSAAQPWHQSD